MQFFVSLCRRHGKEGVSAEVAPLDIASWLASRRRLPTRLFVVDLVHTPAMLRHMFAVLRKGVQQTLRVLRARVDERARFVTVDLCLLLYVVQNTLDHTQGACLLGLCRCTRDMCPVHDPLFFIFYAESVVNLLCYIFESWRQSRVMDGHEGRGDFFILIVSPVFHTYGVHTQEHNRIIRAIGCAD